MPRYKSSFFGNLTRLVGKNKRRYRKKRYNRRKKQMGGLVLWRPKKGYHY